MMKVKFYFFILLVVVGCDSNNQKYSNDLNIENPSEDKTRQILAISGFEYGFGKVFKEEVRIKKVHRRNQYYIINPQPQAFNILIEFETENLRIELEELFKDRGELTVRVVGYESLSGRGEPGISSTVARRDYQISGGESWRLVHTFQLVSILKNAN